MVHDASKPLVGVWKLISFYIQRNGGESVYPFGKNVQGSLIYTENGRMSVHIMRAGRPTFASGDQMRGTTEEIKANYEGVIAYYGSYDLDSDKGLIIHNVQGSLFPNWEGQPQKRFYKLEGNQLQISTPPTLWGGGEQVATLLFEKIE